MGIDQVHFKYLADGCKDVFRVDTKLGWKL
jgi:hypothetical protein